MQIKSTQQTLALHKAVEQHDTEKIRELRSEGHKTVHLNDEKQSPIDLLARRRSIDTGLREKMHGALMSSLNPTAPEGYTKPEALHGSPWGFEILAAGALKGGVNDAKGGSASLEGQVFFSDRTPEKSDDATTRLNLRSKARIYSQGEGMHTSNPVARAFQHRMAQEIRHHLASGKALTTTNKLFTLDVQNEHTPEQATALWLQSKLTGSRINIIQQSENASLAGSAKLLDVPEPFNLKFNDVSQQSFSGEALKQLVDRGAETLQQQLEAGKAPLLGMINNGKIVPMVFGSAGSMT
ncbi:hypothetical protein [Erwinia oleae]|uniref:hypothetical protein n=1 Tax=Erwinia oleae TaxID=796334 RepID=UPI00068B38EB|nr:hypothetical protein [Erwinia oleae]